MSTSNTKQAFPSDTVLELVVAFHERAVEAEHHQGSAMQKGMAFARAGQIGWWLAKQVVDELLDVALARRCKLPTQPLRDERITCAGCSGGGFVQGRECMGCRGAGTILVGREVARG